MISKWWQFWKWHIHRCQTMGDDNAVWGECVVCHEKFGVVDRKALRAYCDREIDEYLRRHGIHDL